MNNGTKLLPVAAALVSACSLAAARPPDEAPPAAAPLAIETGPTDPWMPTPPQPPPDSSLRRGPVLGGPNASVQVNIDSAGLNIVGDAGNEPSLAVNPLNPDNMVIGWRQFDTVASNFRQAGVAYTFDGGRSWTSVGPLEPGVFRSDPVLGVDHLGEFHYDSLRVVDNTYTCHMFHSTNGGRAWSAPNDAVGGDKAWFTVDLRGGPADGRMYKAWNVAGNPFFPNIFSRSLDAGRTWSPPSQIPNFPVFGTLAIDPVGRIYVAGVPNSSLTSTFYCARSVSAGDPLMTPVFEQVVTVNMGGSFTVGQPPNPGGLLGQVQIAADNSLGPMRGNIYMLSSVRPPDGVDPMDVRFARSTDGGTTWNASVRVNDDPAAANRWQWFGTMSIAPNGRLDVVWNDTRESATANLSRLYHSVSTDGGVTWSVNEPLGPQFDSHVGWPNQNKMGDYYHMISDNIGADLAYAATYNGGQDVYYLRIGPYDCNRNGVADETDIALGTVEDCDGNEIPDVCDLRRPAGDCNANAVPDACDIAAGTSRDCNANGRPDECGELNLGPGACCHQGSCSDVIDHCACDALRFVCDVADHLPPTFAGCFGDADGNGFVNPGDRGFVSANIGADVPALLCVFDMDGNGEVNPADRGFISANIGSCTPLPNYMNGSGLNAAGDGPDPRYPATSFQGVGTTCTERSCP